LIVFKEKITEQFRAVLDFVLNGNAKEEKRNLMRDPVLAIIGSFHYLFFFLKEKKLIITVSRLVGMKIFKNMGNNLSQFQQYVPLYGFG
jgi:predicted nucleic acid-binding OB-fold protein